MGGSYQFSNGCVQERTGHGSSARHGATCITHSTAHHHATADHCPCHRNPTPHPPPRTHRASAAGDAGAHGVQLRHLSVGQPPAQRPCNLCHLRCVLGSWDRQRTLAAASVVGGRGKWLQVRWCGWDRTACSSTTAPSTSASRCMWQMQEPPYSPPSQSPSQPQPQPHPSYIPRPTATYTVQFTAILPRGGLLLCQSGNLWQPHPHQPHPLHSAMTSATHIVQFTAIWPRDGLLLCSFATARMQSRSAWRAGGREGSWRTVAVIGRS